MIGRSFRGVLALAGVSLAMVAQPTPSQAFFHNWCGGCGGGTTTYRPYAAAYAPACSPCGTACSPCAPACPQVCNYVPQTCYRSVCCKVPVTCYQPVTTCDPCTGCPRTCLRPVTTYVSQTRLVPYTSYRPVYNNCGYSPCSPCSTGACGSTAVSYSPMASSGCSSCATPSYAPSTSTYTTPSYSTTPSYGPSLTPAPSLSPTPEASTAPSTSAPSTFQNNGTSGTEGTNGTGTAPDERLRPIPDQSSDNHNTKLQAPPRLLDPQDRTTAVPIRRASSYHSVRVEASAAPAAAESLDDGGWRSARR